MKIRYILFFFLGYLILQTQALAVSSNIVVNADSFIIDGEKNIVTASGNIVVYQKDLTLTGKIAKYKQNSQTIYLFENVRVKKGDFILDCNEINVYGKEDKIVASGNISITFGDTYVTAHQAVYDLAEQKIRLTGQPQAWQNQDRLSGEEIIIFPESKRIITKGGTQFILSVDRFR